MHTPNNDARRAYVSQSPGKRVHIHTIPDTKPEIDSQGVVDRRDKKAGSPTEARDCYSRGGDRREKPQAQDPAGQPRLQTTTQRRATNLSRALGSHCLRGLVIRLGHTAVNLEPNVNQTVSHDPSGH